MRIRKILIILLMLLTLTGCTLTIENISNDDILKNVDIILNKEMKYSNKDAVGFQYYLPNSINVKSSSEFNEVLISSHITYYLYADVVSYYYKTNINYKIQNNAYLSKKLSYNGKNGYLEINKQEDKYFVEMMFNYAKIESLVSKSELNDVVSNMSYILSSIKYNKNIIETIVGKKKYELSDSENYNIFKTKKKANNFLDYVNEYDNYDGDIESLIEKEEIKKDDE